jgi:thiol:disulfide interchange protein DsbD
MDHSVRKLIAVLLLLALPLAASAQSSFLTASNQDDFLPVEEAYKVQVDLVDAQTLKVLWQIAPDYYLYQHQFAFALKPENSSPGISARYSAAIDKTDEYFGDVRVYYDFADIDLSAATPIPDGTVLTITSQGCADAGLCYPPRTDYFELQPTTGQILSLTDEQYRQVQQSLNPSPQSNTENIWLILLFALIGGAILNLMPCVFPILSLKVLGFVSGDPKQNHIHSWYYTTGVVISFVLIASLILALKAAGQAVGWGFQLQSTEFVGLLALLFFAMALALSGLTELGTSFMGLGSSLAQGTHAKSSFFTGVLAVVVASPCTAPFMGTALGFALTQSPFTALLVFTALGLGMALPMVALSYSTTLRRWLPKPGMWMVTFRQFLAFPLYLTVIWLLWIAGRQAGVDTLATLMVACLLVAMSLWLWSQRGWAKRLSALSFASAIVLTFNPPTDTTEAHTSTAFSRSHLNTLIAGDQPVFVDVTADWCITCIANEKAVLETTEIQQIFAERNVIYHVIDWTNYDPAVADFLAEFQRSGIPFYLVYPGNNEPPITLPQILTKDIVLRAIGAR